MMTNIKSCLDMHVLSVDEIEAFLIRIWGRMRESLKRFGEGICEKDCKQM